jgi:hypothetical protein
LYNTLDVNIVGITIHIKHTLLIIKKHICGLQSIIDKCRICGTEGETIEHIISFCTVLAQSEYKILAKIIHMNLAVKFNLLKNTQPHYKGCFFKFGVEVGGGESIEIAPLV